jgi:hypothetical protein
VNEMMPLGPEALLVGSRTDARVELAEFLRLEYAGVEPRYAIAIVRREVEPVPARRPPADRLRRWARSWLRRDDEQRAADPEVGSRARGARADGVAAGATLGGATLAAMPAIQGGPCAEGGPLSLSAMPALGRS